MIFSGMVLLDVSVFISSLTYTGCLSLCKTFCYMIYFHEVQFLT